jgi:hypothetical protein
MTLLRTAFSQVGPWFVGVLSWPGRVAVDRPIPTLIAAVLVAAVMIAGIPRVEVDDTLHGLFRSNTPEYIAYQRLIERFPSHEHDIFVVLEDVKLGDRAQLEQIRDLHFDLQLAEGVTGVTSIFTLRAPPTPKGHLPSLFPDDLPDGADLEALLAKVQSNPLVPGRLLSPASAEGQLLVLIVALNQDVLEKQGLEAGTQGVRQTVAEARADTGLKIGMTGVALMKLKIFTSTQSEAFLFMVLGTLVGALICLLFFRDLRLFVIANFSPIFSVLSAFGLYGWLGGHLDPLIIGILPLILVIAFSDSMHLVSAIRRRLVRGSSATDAVRHTVMLLGPACALTSLTTATAFSCLLMSESETIRTFGMTAAAATLFAYLTMITTLPALALLLLRRPNRKGIPGDRRNFLLFILRWESLQLFDRLRRFPFTVAVSCSLLIIIMATFYLRLHPSFRLSDLIPSRHETSIVSNKLEAALSGTQPLSVLIEFPDGITPDSAVARATIERVHAILKAQPGVESVTSLVTIYELLRDLNVTTPDQQKKYLKELPQNVRSRFTSPATRSALVQGYVRDLDVKQISKIVEQVDANLATIRSRAPDTKLAVTGLAALSAYRSVSIINQLSGGLLWSVGIVSIMIAIGFGSLRIAALSIPPNIFGQVTLGAGLYLLGQGLNYPTAIALIVAFGLSVDDTIHFLNRLQHEANHRASRMLAVKATMEELGPVIVLTAIILILGIGVTTFSDLPTTRDFGIACILTLLVGIAGDLVLLPSLLLAWPKLIPGKRTLHSAKIQLDGRRPSEQ